MYFYRIVHLFPYKFIAFIVEKIADIYLSLCDILTEKLEAKRKKVCLAFRLLPWLLPSILFGFLPDAFDAARERRLWKLMC
jgi:hypothetical protein